MLLIFYLLIVFKTVKFVNMSFKANVNKKIFQEFGRILREKRRGKKLTQEELANLAGIHRTYIAGIERGIRNPSLKNIVRLGRALKIEIKELLKNL